MDSLVPRDQPPPSGQLKARLLRLLAGGRQSRPTAWAAAFTVLLLDLGLVYSLGNRHWDDAVFFTFSLVFASHAVIAWLLLRLSAAAGKKEEVVDVVARYRELQRAMQHGDFVLHYQPEVSFASNEVRAFEALVRWRQPNGDEMPPADFIPYTEEVGLIRPLGTWILREACAQLATWRANLPAARDLRISVNVSSVQLDDPKFVSVVQSALRDADLPPEALILEVTESGLVSDPKVFRVILRQLQDLGVKVAVDDFGTGYASINYLRAFRFDYVKLERSFVSPLEEGHGDSDLIAGLVTLAKGLGAEVIAEGISTAKLAAVCHGLGCEWGQGHYFSPPAPAAEVEALLASPVSVLAA